MKEGWIGNTALQERLHRADPDASVILEAIRTVNEDVRVTKAEWDAGSVTGSGFQSLADGGGKISGSRRTLAQQITKSAQVGTTLFRGGTPFSVVEIEWSGLSGADTRELDRLTVNLDPDANSTGVEVTEWRAQLYRAVDPGESDPSYELEPISAIAKVAHGGGTSAADVTFDFRALDKSTPPRIGGTPRGGSNRLTYLFVWAVKGEGEPAGNVAWMGDSGTSSASGSGYTARHAHLTPTSDALEEQGGGVGGTRYLRTLPSGIPHFVFEDVSFAATTVTFSGANKLDLGATPTEDVEVVALGQRHGKSAITWELAVPGSGTWVAVVDGDIIGEDNTANGGTDLSGLAVRQDYDARATLTPEGDHTSPVARRIGIRERESIGLTGIATLREYSQALDPVDLHAEIGRASIEIIKDGVTDYRDFFTDLFSTQHIGQIEFRAWYGSPNLARQHWLYLDDFIVNDHASAQAHGEVICSNLLVLLRGLIPAYDTGTDEREPKEYSNSLISAAYDDVLTTQLPVPARRVGAGPPDPQIDSDADGTEDTSALVTKRIEESDGKSELEALAYLAGGSVVSSQGRIKYVHLHESLADDPTPHPVDVIPLEEGAVSRISPGYQERVDEWFVPWGWDRFKDDGRGAYQGEVRAFHSAGITKLGDAHLRDGSPPREREEVARWIPQSGTDSGGVPVSGLAEKVSKRQTTALGVGMITFDVVSTYARPYLELGDVIAVETDRFVGKDPNSDTEVRGLQWLIGPVVRIGDMEGRKLTVWVRSYGDILPSDAKITRVKYAAPRITDLSARFDDDGNLSVTAVANSDAGSVKVAVSTSSYPGESTVDAQTAFATDSDGEGEVTGFGPYDVGDTLWISAKAYENADGSGAESQSLFKIKVIRQRGTSQPTVSFDPSQSGSTITVDVTVEDLALQATAVEFQKKDGAGDFGGTWVDTWDSSTGTAGTDETLERSEDLTAIGKHNVQLKVRVSYTDSNGNAQTFVAAYTGDVDEIPHATIEQISFTAAGELLVALKGDEDTADIRVTWSVGASPSEPSDPTGTDTALGSRSGVLATGVTADPGDTAWVKALGEDGGGSLAATSEIAEAKAVFGVDSAGIVDGSVIAAKITKQAQAFSIDFNFTGSDEDTVSWGAGTLTTADGDSYSINSGNTGNMLALTTYYIYFAESVSTTTLQVSTNASAIVGNEDRILLCVAQEAVEGDTAFFVPAVGVLGVTGDQIAAGSIVTNHLQANVVTAAKINVATLSAITANIGTVTAGTVDTNVLISSDTFDASSATFSGAVTVEAGAGGLVIQLKQSGGGSGEIAFAPTVGAQNPTIGVDGSENIVLNPQQGSVLIGGGRLEIPSMPTSDPGVTGQLWNDSGTVKIS